MNKAALVWACLLCAGCGKRVQMQRSPRRDAAGGVPYRGMPDALTKLLLALNSQAFSPSSSAALSPARKPKYDPRCEVRTADGIDVVEDHSNAVDVPGEGAGKIDVLGGEVHGNVLIKGPASQVDRVERMLREICAGQPVEYEVTVDVPQSDLQNLLGPSDRNLKWVSESTDCEIEVGESPPGEAPVKVTITGKSESGIDKAEELMSKFIAGDTLAVKHLSCPRECVGRVIGPNKRCLALLERQTECSVELLCDRRLANWVPCRLTAKGLASKMDDAIARIEQTIRAGEEYFENNVTMEIPRAQVKHLIGTKGRNLNRIMDETNCLLQLVDSSANAPAYRPALLLFKGGLPEVEAAQEMVEKLLATSGEEKEEVYVECPRDMVDALLGPKGATITELRRSLGVWLKVENSDLDPSDPSYHLPCRVVIRAAPEEIDQAQQAVKRFISAGTGKVTMKLQKHQLGRLAGPDAPLHLSYLQKATGCFILLGDVNGERVSFVDEEDDKMEDDLYTLTIEGPNAKLGAAQRRINQYLATAHEELTQTVIRVPKQTVPKLMGREGRNLRKIAKRTDCLINVQQKR